jgi:hypothetical protein
MAYDACSCEAHCTLVSGSPYAGAPDWLGSPQQQQQQRQPSPLTCSPAPTACPQQLAAAKQQAEALLAEVHAEAVQALSSGTAADSKLLAKQLRLQRNQAFEAAKALLHKALSLNA